MKPRTLALFTAMTLFAVLGLTVQNPAQTIITFDPPGSTNTYAFGINPAGAITGYYFGNGVHGFLRAADGTITTFDPPGSTITYVLSINPAGAITGYFYDASSVPHGFPRSGRHHHDVRCSGRWHRPVPGHLRPWHQPGRRDHGNLH